MPKYTTTEAQRDALRIISDCLFNVRLVFKDENKIEKTLWIPIVALNKDDAEKKVIEWANDFGIKDMVTTAFQTLNSIEETIK